VKGSTILKKEIETIPCFVTGHRRWLFSIYAALTIYSSLSGCNSPAPNRVQGYVEGEFVYLASPVAGELKSLRVLRGMQAKTGDIVFELDRSPERAMRDEAQQRLVQARANLEDMKKGKRPTEVESVEAQLRQAQDALIFSEKDLARQEELLPRKATAAQDVDRARSGRDQNRQRVSQVKADLETARLGARTDQIAAAEANIQAMQAALSRAEWDLSQKSRISPQAGLVFDTFFREGEWVAAGRPVVALLPPENIKVRAFVPETWIGKIHSGDNVQVFADGLRQPLIGKVSFISPSVEFTPPVIYSRETRDKLVFMIEAIFDGKTSAALHPGQPVDVQFGF
jgi:HlyD family secretion protein